MLRATQALEWCYIAAHDLLMHFIMVFTSFVIPERRDQRAPNVRAIAVRGGPYILLLLDFAKVRSSTRSRIPG